MYYHSGGCCGDGVYLAEQCEIVPWITSIANTDIPLFCIFTSTFYYTSRIYIYTYAHIYTYSSLFLTLSLHTTSFLLSLFSARSSTSAAAVPPLPSLCGAAAWALLLHFYTASGTRPSRVWCSTPLSPAWLHWRRKWWKWGANRGFLHLVSLCV